MVDGRWTMTQSENMTITALAPWFGGKRNLSGDIVAELGEHRAYWEPFAGSMAVLLSKPPCSMETVNDLHGHLVNLARVVRDSELGPRLYRMLRRTLMHEEFFAESDGQVREEERLNYFSQGIEGIDRISKGRQLMAAYDYFLVSWMGRNGTAGTPASHKGTFCVRYTNRGGHAGRRWSGAVNSIPAWRRRLADVTIIRRDAFELIERIADEERVAIYCDPPYLVKGARYLHDDNVGRPASVSDAEWSETVALCRRQGPDLAALPPERQAWHLLLARRLSRFCKARVVVSYYDHELLSALYPAIDGWHCRRLKAAKAMVHAGQRGNSGRVDAPEVLLINGPSLVEKEGLF